MSRLLQEKLAQLESERKNVVTVVAAVHSESPQSQGTPAAQRVSSNHVATTQKRDSYSDKVKFGAEIEQQSKKIQQELELKRKETETQLRTQFDQGIQKMRSELQLKEDEQKAILQREFSQRLSEMTRTLEQEYQASVESTRRQSLAQREQQEAELQRLQSEVSVQRSSLLKQLSELETSEQSDFKKHMSDKRTLWERQQREEEQQLQQRFEETRENWMRRLESTNQEWAQKLELSNQEWSHRWEATQQDWQQKLLQLQHRMESEENKMMQELETRRNALMQQEMQSLESKSSYAERKDVQQAKKRDIFASSQHTSEVQQQQKQQQTVPVAASATPRKHDSNLFSLDQEDGQEDENTYVRSLHFYYNIVDYCQRRFTCDYSKKKRTFNRRR